MTVVMLTASGCGDDERAAMPADAKTPTTTPKPTPTAPARARSVRECAQLWNADALAPGNYQVSANEFVAEVAPVRVRVAYGSGHCFVVTPIGHRRIAISTAVHGRRPFTNPDRRSLKRGERVDYNARADRDGRVTLDKE
jgi:hypothetical protein